MKVGSLFSGIGGFDYGLEKAGMQVVWQSEIEPYCCEVLKKHWPHVPNFGDIFKIKDPPAVDLICGGFPCQPFSVAGKRKGKADDRYIWPEMLRIITEVKPRWVFAENVPGIIGVELEQAISDLEGAGYETARTTDGQPICLLIPVAGLGAPHYRYRVWIPAYSEHNRLNWEKICLSGRGSYKAVVNPAGSDRHAPDSKSIGCGEKDEIQTGRNGLICQTNDVADPTESRGPIGLSGQDNGQQGNTGIFDNGGTEQDRWQIPWPEVATRLCRVDDGLPAWVHRHRVKRLKALGNAIVPQIAEEIGRMILEIDF